jgi:hypothetical protein
MDHIVFAHSGVSVMTKKRVAAQERSGEDGPGAEFATGNNPAAPMDLPPSGDGLPEIHQPAAL